MRVRTKIRILFLFVIGIALSTSAISLWSVVELRRSLHATNESVQTQLAVEQFRSQLRSELTKDKIERAVSRESDGEFAEYKRLQEGWYRELDQLEELVSGDAALEDIVQRIRGIIKGMYQIVDYARQYSKRGSSDWDSGYFSENFVPGLNMQVDRAIEIQGERVAAATAQANRSETRVVILVTVTTVLLLLVATLGLTLFRRWLLVPILTLSDATRNISGGEYESEIPIEGESEFARLARDIESMAQSIAHFQEQLVEKERMAAVGEMTASVAHNVRNPLASIRALSQSCQRDQDLAPELKGVLGTVIETVDRADRWLKDLLTALRPVKIQSNQEPFRQVLEDVVNGARIFSERKGVSLELELDESLPPRIPLDRRKFEQALIVFISNAVEASEPESGIEIRARLISAGSARVLLEIQDYGHGMDADTKSQLFTPYFTTKKSGIGLGLCLAQKIIFGHRGTITVDSEPNLGCRISIWLPIATAPLSRSTPSSHRAASPRRSGRRVRRPDQPRQVSRQKPV